MPLVEGPEPYLSASKVDEDGPAVQLLLPRVTRGEVVRGVVGHDQESVALSDLLCVDGKGRLVTALATRQELHCELQGFFPAPFTGLSPRQFGKLVTALRREGADPVRRGRPWSLPLEDRVLLVAAYWRTNLTLRQLAPLFGVSKSAADRIVDHLGPALALQRRRRFRKDTVLIVDGTLVPTRDHKVAEQSKNYRYSTNHQVVIDADTRLVVAVGRPLPGNRNDCKAWELSGAKDAVGRTTVIADGGYRGTGLVIPHRRAPGQTELPEWKEEHNASHRKVRARVEHAFARMKTWKILRDCRLKGDGVHHAMLGIARLHNLALAG